MNLDTRLRRLEAVPSPDPEMTGLSEWAATIGIENMRLLRDHLRSALVDADYDLGIVWDDQRLRLALESAPPSLRQLFRPRPV
ncbi:MAG: hypothetical protein K1X87_11420 [Dehalococcoidia bacterium]|nr:hypothetical protein [Dehalococcoidia bacterium]